MGHVEGRAIKPALYAVVNDIQVLADGSTAVTEEQIEAQEKRIEDFETKTYLTWHIIINSVSISLGQSIGQLMTAKEMWDAIVQECKGKTLLYQVNVCHRLQEMKCAEGKDVKAHLSEMSRYHEELAGMGAMVNDNDFTAMMIGSLPESY